ncbi:hypothetical protein L3X38_024586 [Prunus dulcis]|uniref:GAG-pre-integrase domain-containing protein n=1 Tax=Prunus dulcis TaxID=3755 RepID=A0AAD4W170_PRUDU|nr:hypothetical protein L3X38_024586 [Prunus dulcis]
MSGTPMILPLIADSQKHAVNPADPATRTHAYIATTKGKTIGYGTRRGKLYYLDWAPDSAVKVGQAFTTSGSRSEEKREKIWLWHKRLGHASFGYLKKLFPSLFSSLDVSSFQCDTCELAQSYHVPFLLSSNKSLVSFSLIHSDVWGPVKIATPAGAQWFQHFYQMVETQFHARIQVLRSDNGGEFVILTSSYKIRASYINAHALTRPNRMGWLKERTDTYWKKFMPLSLVQYAKIILGRSRRLCSIPYQSDSL